MKRELKKLDLKNYEIPKNDGGRDLKKNQRLALEIIAWCQIPKKYQGFWWKKVKLFTAYTEDRFNELKRRGIKNANYLRKMIFK